MATAEQPGTPVSLRRCSGRTHELYPEDRGFKKDELPAEWARIWLTYCRDCPEQTKQECLDDGMWEKHGMWGGLSPEERRQFQKYSTPPEPKCYECGKPIEGASALSWPRVRFHKDCHKRRTSRLLREKRESQIYTCPRCGDSRQPQARSCPCGWKAVKKAPPKPRSYE